MAVIEGGQIITGRAIEGSTSRRYAITGAPVAGTTLAGVIAPGEFVQDVTTEDLYEYTEPAGAPTYTRIDTVAGA